MSLKEIPLLWSKYGRNLGRFLPTFLDNRRKLSGKSSSFPGKFSGELFPESFPGKSIKEVRDGGALSSFLSVKLALSHLTYYI